VVLPEEARFAVPLLLKRPTKNFAWVCAFWLLWGEGKVGWNVPILFRVRVGTNRDS
jgi:hypothetical protein